MCRHESVNVQNRGRDGLLRFGRGTGAHGDAGGGGRDLPRNHSHVQRFHRGDVRGTARASVRCARHSILERLFDMAPTSSGANHHSARATLAAARR